MQPLPVIYCAFAMDKSNGLTSLQGEKRGINEALLFLRGKGIIDQEEDELYDENQTKKAISNFIDRIDIFHFAGHAGADRIQIKKDAILHVKRLAAMLGIRVTQEKPNNGIKLVFLNGCSTRAMAEVLFNEGKVKAVIATNTKIGDEVAAKYAISFYEKLAIGRTLEQAFRDAKNNFGSKALEDWEPEMQIKKVAIKLGRCVLNIPGTENDEDDLPLGLYHREDCPEILNWRITEPEPVVEENMVLQQITRSLKNFNFDQRQQFGATVRKLVASAYLVHGDSRNGQSWLSHNLFLEHTDFINQKESPEVLNIVSIEPAVQIVQKIKEKIGIKSPLPVKAENLAAEVALISQKINNFLDTRSLAIIVHNGGTYLRSAAESKRFISDFWKPLANVLNQPSPAQKGRLILVLLEKNEVIEEDHPIFCRSENLAESPPPIYLDPLTAQDLSGHFDAWLKREEEPGPFRDWKDNLLPLISGKLKFFQHLSECEWLPFLKQEHQGTSEEDLLEITKYYESLFPLIMEKQFNCQFKCNELGKWEITPSIPA